jgi:hypothetical protein
MSKCNSVNIALYDKLCEDDECAHSDDYATCEDCGNIVSVKTLKKRYFDKQNIITCPCCKGTGTVKKENV